MDKELNTMNDVRKSDGERSHESGSSPLVKGLRIVGALALCISAITFLAQSWHMQPDLYRYGYFLIFSLSLVALGLVCGIKLQEPKGARTFLSVFSSMLPIHCAVLGGLIYSLYGKVPTNLPRAFVWIAPDESSLMLVTVGAILTLIPGVIFSFRTLYRTETYHVSIFYIFTNLLLLLPFRGFEYSLGVGVLMLTGLVVFDAILQGKNSESQSFDARMVRSMLFVAPLCFSIRALGYTTDAEIFSVIFFHITAFLLIAPFASKDSFIAFLTGIISVGTIICGWSLLGGSLIDTFNVPKEYQSPFFSLPLIVYCFAVTPLVRDNLRKFFYFSGALIGVVGAFFQLLAYESVVSSLYAISVSLGFIFYGVKSKSLAVTNVGVLSLCISLLYHLKYLEKIYETMGAWLSLGVAGILVLVTASLIERKNKGISERVKEFYKNLK